MCIRDSLLGVQLDSVMNYPFAEAVTDFASNGVAESFESSVMTIIENSPKEALDVLMNHIDVYKRQLSSRFISDRIISFRLSCSFVDGSVSFKDVYKRQI